MRLAKLQKLEMKQQLQVVVMCVVVGVVGRIMPHLPNVTPLTSLSLFASAKLQRVIAILTLLATFVISDALLAMFYGYPVFSLWTIFVYSGFVIITVCGRFLAQRLTWTTFPMWIGFTSLFYWLWTNCGVWLTSGLYSKNFAGLLTCYAVALPFLRNALIGDLIWGAVIFGVFAFIKHKREWRDWQTRWI